MLLFLVFIAHTLADATAWTTTTDRSKDLTKVSVAWDPTTNVPDDAVVLDLTQKNQVMDGFGAAMTGSSAYNLMLMSESARNKWLQETFSKSGYHHSYVRVAIGCSDFSLSEYTCCDKQGIENFALTEEETKYVIPILKKAKEFNPDLKIMAAPWTSPRWMKIKSLTDKTQHNSWTSGVLNPDYYQDYAEYFVKWVQAFEKEGLSIYAVTPQNEPLNKGNSASLYMGWEQQRDFIKNALGPKFKTNNIKAKIFVFDHNYHYDGISNENDYPLKIYNDSTAAGYIAGSAWHNYGGDVDELWDIHNQRSDKDIVFTETSIGTWNDGRNLSSRLLDDMENVGLKTIERFSTGVIFWNYMLDSNRGPYRPGGCATCYGAVDIFDNYTRIVRNSHYYVASHLSVAAKTGSRRIGTKSTTYPENLSYRAFDNPDGTYGMVVINNNSYDRWLTIYDGTHKFNYLLPTKSVTSFNWPK